MILLYHHILPESGTLPAGESSAHSREAHTTAQLEMHLKEFTRRGFSFVPLRELVGEIARRGWEPWRKIAVTFDDGWTDNYFHAVPVLQKLNVPATFFVTTEHIHQGISDPQRMGVGQLKDLLLAGMTIGAHSRSHPNLLEMSETEASGEIAGSKKDLESALGTNIEFFAYPYGAHHQAQVNLVRAAGYSAAFSAGSGAQNTRLGLYWLFRHGLSPKMNHREDRRAFSPAQGLLRGLYRDLRKRVGWPIKAFSPRRKAEAVRWVI